MPAKFSEKQTFLTPDTHLYARESGDKNVSFSENFVHALH